MAVQNLSDFSAALSQLFDPLLQRQVNRHTVLLSLLMKMDGKGKNCAWDARFTGATAGTYTEGADVGAGDLQQDINEDAILSWGQYRSNFGVSGLATAASGTSQGNATELLDMIASDALDSAAVLASEMNADLYNGSGANSIIGLDSALATTGTYAGIAKATYPEWEGNVDTNSGTPRALTKGLLDALEAAVFTASGMRSSIIVTTPLVAVKYENLLDAVTRQILEGGELAPIVRNMGAPIADMNGFTGLHYKGIPVFRDKDCPAGTLHMLNLDTIEFQTLPQFKRSTATSFLARMLADDKGRPAGVNARLEALAKTGDADKFSLKLYPQMKVRRPNANALLEDIDES
jgi:hypothetical protein